MKRKSDIVTIIVFFVLLFGFFFSSLLLKDEEISFSERRKKALLPSFNLQGVLNGKYMKNLDAYFLDQFPLRDSFRGVGTGFRFHIFLHRDVNNIFIEDGIFYKTEYPLKEKEVLLCSKKINSITKKYLSNANVYYSIIPDKGYFLKTDKHLNLDYNALVSTYSSSIDKKIKYIDIFDLLSINDYYVTDSHWRQEKISDVAQALTLGMGVDFVKEDFSENLMYPFVGVYSSQSGIKQKGEELIYLTNPTILSAKVQTIEDKKTLGIYSSQDSTDLLMDKYNVFLHGAKAVVKITNPNAKTDKKLVIFRDSFASSLSVLMTASYKEITLVDLRYISEENLKNSVDFNGKDVLFLFSTSLINSAGILK